MTSITFCSIFSALSNEMLFKKIRHEMVEKKQKTLVFLKILYLGQKTFLFRLSWFLSNGYSVDILKFKFEILPCYASTAEFSMTSWIFS